MSVWVVLFLRQNKFVDRMMLCCCVVASSCLVFLSDRPAPIFHATIRVPVSNCSVGVVGVASDCAFEHVLDICHKDKNVVTAKKQIRRCSGVFGNLPLEKLNSSHRMSISE